MTEAGGPPDAEAGEETSRTAAPATETGRTPLPPDPDAYDSPRAVQARARGLAAPYIPGGEDPELEDTRRRERRYLRLLLVMIAVVVLGGFVLGIAANMLGLPGLLGGVD
jgi:hypothetical protein